MPAPTDVKVTFTGDTSALAAATKTANAAIASTGAAADKAAKQAEKAAQAQAAAQAKVAAQAQKEAQRAADAQAKAASIAQKDAQAAADKAVAEARRVADEQARQAQRAADAQAKAAQAAADAQARAIREQEQQMADLGEQFARMAAAAEKAGDRLRDIGDSGDDMAKARTEADRLLAEIALLEQQTGDTAAAERARAAVLAGLDDKQKKIASSANDSADKIGKVGGASNKLAGFLSVLSPGLADATRNIGDLADGGELAAEASAALGVSLGAVAAGAGMVASAALLLAAAYVGWNEEAATATRLTEQQNALTAATAPLYADTEAAIRGAKVELGLMTEAQAEMIENGISGLEQYQAATETTRKRLSELRAAQSSITGQVGALVGDIGEALPLQEYNLLAQIIDGVTTSTSEFDTEEGRLHDGLIATSGELKRNREAHAALTDAKEKGRAATEKFTAMEKAAESAAQARADAEAELKKVLEERAKQEEAYAEGVAALRDIERDANADRLTEMQALDQAHADQIASLNASLTAQLAAVEGNELKQQEIEQAGRDARLALEQRYQRDKGQIIAEGNAAVAEANAKAQADAAATQAATQEAQIGLAQAGAQSLVDITSAIYGGMTDAGLKKGLKAAFAASKAAALAQAGINTALAFSNALAAPLPPPLPQIAAAAALVSGLAAAAGIAAQQPPSFRSGYMPDQQLAMIEPQSEMVVPAAGVQAMGGMDAARAAFAGMSAAPAPTVTRFTMGHREFSALTQGSARRPGPLRDLTIRPGAGRVNPHSRGSNG